MSNIDQQQAKLTEPSRSGKAQQTYLYRTKRIDEILHTELNSPKYLSQGHCINALTEIIVRLIDEECQMEVKRHIVDSAQWAKQTGAAPCAETTDPRQLQRANADTDPATRYALYANVLAANGVNTLSAELLRSIDALISLSKNWK